MLSLVICFWVHVVITLGSDVVWNDSSIILLAAFTFVWAGVIDITFILKTLYKIW